MYRQVDKRTKDVFTRERLYIIQLNGNTELFTTFQYRFSLIHIPLTSFSFFFLTTNSRLRS